MTATKKTTKTAPAKKAAAKAKPKTSGKNTKVATQVPAEKTPTPETKSTKKKAAREETPKKLSALDAAAKVLVESGEPMNTKQMVEAMATKGYWTSPGGKTPHATLYSAILREIATKKSEARFHKTAKGHFAAKA